MCVEPEEVSDRVWIVWIGCRSVFFYIFESETSTGIVYIFFYSEIPCLASDAWFQCIFCESFYILDGIIYLLLSCRESSYCKSSRYICSIPIQLNTEVYEHNISGFYVSHILGVVERTAIDAACNNRWECLGSMMPAESVCDERLYLVFIHSWLYLTNYFIIDRCCDTDAILYFCYLIRSFNHPEFMDDGLPGFVISEFLSC